MEIKKCFYEELPDWVDKTSLSNNGSGKEFASYLIIEHNDYKKCYSDAMEPEDSTFGRDLQWIQDELWHVFQLGAEYVITLGKFPKSNQ